MYQPFTLWSGRYLLKFHYLKTSLERYLFLRIKYNILVLNYLPNKIGTFIILYIKLKLKLSLRLQQLRYILYRIERTT